jgi:hypothetical protein
MLRFLLPEKLDALDSNHWVVCLGKYDQIHELDPTKHLILEHRGIFEHNRSDRVVYHYSTE